MPNPQFYQQPGETREQFIERKRQLGLKGGAARKGTRNKATVDREKELEEFKNLTARRRKTLWSAQMVLAMGSIQVFRIDTETVGQGKNKKTFKKKPVLVTNTEEIIKALDFEYAEGDDPNDEETYYFVTTKDAENKAIDSLLDRTFGKAKESVAVEHSGYVGLADLLGKGALDTKDKDHE